MDIGPGDFVECVGSRSGPTSPNTRLTKGAIYRARAVGVVPPGYVYSGEPYVDLEEMPALDGNFGYHASQFRPIYRPNAGLIRDLQSFAGMDNRALAPTPETYGERG